MLRHIRSKHPNALANKTPATQHHSTPSGEGRKKELDDALVTMIVKDLQPFSIVEDEGFQELVKKLDPTYVLPSRKTVKLMVRQKYQEEKQKAMEHLKNIPSVCLTADMWTSLTMESYLGVTCHYTDSSTELGSVVLGVSKFPKQHTADNIKEALSDVISDWGLTGSVAAMVTDYAANIVSGIQKLGLHHLPCFAHTINLIVKMSSNIMPLSSADFDIISESLEVLAPFKYATEELSAEKRVSASKIIPIIRMIQHKVAEKTALARNASASFLGTALQKYINKRCSNSESIRVLALATLLDPRFKTLGFGNQDNACEAEWILTGECASIIRITTEHSSQAETSSSSSSQAAQTPPSSDDLWELLDSRVSETQRHHSSNSDATIEVKRYLRDAYLPRSEDPLKYWHVHKEYPHLYALAREYLAITATSVPCERIFSKAGDVISKKRSRLSSSTAEQVIFLNKNL
ncbi:hypothetical protein QQF64_034552 [Cirrhinus molitorella]|uniref:HAT C-terminal dimerisation domain-containing protein n=1 Tax=Cirrhinus molitorella TaxID=172907 RepID=A0ABR3L136_9TELE